MIIYRYEEVIEVDMYKDINIQLCFDDKSETKMSKGTLCHIDYFGKVNRCNVRVRMTSDGFYTVATQRRNELKRVAEALEAKLN